MTLISENIDIPLDLFKFFCTFLSSYFRQFIIYWAKIMFWKFKFKFKFKGACWSRLSNSRWTITLLVMVEFHNYLCFKFPEERKILKFCCVLVSVNFVPNSVCAIFCMKLVQRLICRGKKGAEYLLGGGGGQEEKGEGDCFCFLLFLFYLLL